MVLRYADCQRRLARVEKADVGDRDLIFLTKNGNPYAPPTAERSSAINVEMHSLRRKAARLGIGALRDFYFHQTRATFATQLTVTLLPIAGVAGTLAMVKEALLHKDESTTLKYIKFVQHSPIKEAIANEFTKAFMGIFTAVKGAEHE
jgi:integrase